MILRTLLIAIFALVFAGTLHAAEVGATAADLDTDKVQQSETAIGNFAADALRAATGANIAVLHAAAFRPQMKVPAGKVDDQVLRDLFALPTEKVATINATPAVLRKMLQRALGKYPDANTAYLQISGMEVMIDPAKTGAARICEIRVNGKAIDFNDGKTTYTVAMPLTLGKGAAGYILDFTKPVTDTLVALDNITIFDAVIKAFENAADHTINPKVEGRIRVK